MTTERDAPTQAAEYVLGLLEGEARTVAEQRLATDEAFARSVGEWRTKFAELDDTADEIAPVDDLWSRIEQGTTVRTAAAEPAPGLLHRLWSDLAALRIATLSGTVAAVVFAVLAVTTLQHAREVSARKPIYVAILIDDASRQAGAVVNAFADGRVEMIPLVDINVPQGRALQVWTLWNREVGPRSVGLLSRARATPLNLQNLPTTGADQLFEITLEPAGGSPTGRPTGPILYKGNTARTL